MSYDDRERWYRRKRRPFFGDWFFGDFDDAFREMEEIMEKEFKNFSERVPKEMIRERTLPDGTKVSEWGPFVYGYSMTIGADGKPQIREFGNLKPEMGAGRTRIGFKEEREPLIDVVKTNGEVKVIAELPGVDKNDIRVQGTNSSLTISVDTPQRKYFKEIMLPAEVEPKQARSHYRNGVLEVTLPKKKEEKTKGEQIKIE